MTDDDIIKVRDDIIEAAMRSPKYGATDGPDDVSIAIEFARVIEQRTIERCAAVCRPILDEEAERKAEQRAREAQGTNDELRRLRFASDTRLFNAGVRRCIDAIRALGAK